MVDNAFTYRIKTAANIGVTLGRINTLVAFLEKYIETFKNKDDANWNMLDVTINDLKKTKTMLDESFQAAEKIYGPDKERHVDDTLAFSRDLYDYKRL